MAHPRATALLAALCIAGVAAFDCSPCAADPGGYVCCACCVAGVLQPGLCNAPQFYGCLPTPTATMSAVNPSFTSTMSWSPHPSVNPLTPRSQNKTLAFSTACSVTYWQVPAGVRNMTIRLWGAGGSAGPARGGSGAFVEGMAYVTPNETLRIQVGGNSGDPASCGFGGLSADGIGPAGGASSVARFVTQSSTWVFIVVAGGGGASGGLSGGPGYGVVAGSSCGPYLPQGGNAGSANWCYFIGGGGGGWTGGWPGGGCYGGDGGTSCAPYMIAPTVSSVNGNLEGYPANQLSPYYIPGTGGSQQPGAVVLSWDGINPSPSRSPAGTSSASATATQTRSASTTGTRTARSSASITASATRSPYCALTEFTLLPSTDLVGTDLGGVSLHGSEQSCQQLCCDTSGCSGYSFGSLHVTLGTQGPCVLLANLTAVVPSHTFVSGVLTRMHSYSIGGSSGSSS